MKKDLLYAIGNVSLMTIAVTAVCTALNMLCIWFGSTGLSVALVLAICSLLYGWDMLSAEMKPQYVVCIILTLAFYMFSVVIQGQFAPTAVAIGILSMMLIYFKNVNASIYTLCIVSYVLGVEFSFIMMGEEIPANEMKTEYLAMAAVGVTWLLTCMQAVRDKKFI